jgi:ribonuclease HI
VHLDLLLSVTKTSPLQLQRDAFLSTHDIRFENFIVIYTDGSLIAGSSAHFDITAISAAFYIPHIHATAAYRLPTFLSICTAELYAILRALLYIQKNIVQFSAPYISNGIVICSDSQPALQMIGNCKPDDCGFVHSIHLKLIELKQITKLTVSFQWVPSHCDILGNETADKLAKDVHLDSQQPILDLPQPYGYMKRSLLMAVTAEFDAYWRTIGATTHLASWDCLGQI